MEQFQVNQLRWLTIYALLSSGILLGLLLDRFGMFGQKSQFREISVERINVVEKDGPLKMVISNQARQHSGMVSGKPIPDRPRPAGLIFFNSLGDECGGLVYDSDTQESSLSFSVDQFRNDQIMQLQYGETRSDPQHTRQYELKLWDQSDAFPLARRVRFFDSLQTNADEQTVKRAVSRLKAQHLLSEERLFVGRNPVGEVGLFIRDGKGRARIRLFVDKSGSARVEALDSTGRPTAFLPAQTH